MNIFDEIIEGWVDDGMAPDEAAARIEMMVQEVGAILLDPSDTESVRDYLTYQWGIEEDDRIDAICMALSSKPGEVS